VVLIDPSGDQVKYMVHLEFKATNNMVEYEALIFGLKAGLSLGIHQLLVKGDSQLIIKQVRGECSCNEPRHAAYLLHVRKLEKDFMALELQHVPRADNSAVDELSTRASTWAPVVTPQVLPWLEHTLVLRTVNYMWQRLRATHKNFGDHVLIKLPMT
jgi:ribonuclease HI